MQSQVKIVLLFLFILLSSCDQINNKKETELSARLTQLENSIAEQKRDLNSIKDQYHKLSEQVLDFRIENDLSQMAFFTPDTKSAQPITTNAGIFFISLRNIEKYANGFKLLFQIGNPSSITIESMEIEVIYGPLNNKRKYKITLTKPILASQWNDFSVVLAPASENDLAHIAITVNPTEFALPPDLRKDDSKDN